MAELSAAERRTHETRRLLEAAKRAAKRHGVSIKAPAPDTDVEQQRVNLIAYAADVLEAVDAAQTAVDAASKPGKSA